MAVYSMWDGYVTDKFRNVLAEHGISYEHVHTSGHAVVSDLQRLANAINPNHIIPIHTFYPQDYPSLFGKVRLVDDGEVISI